MEQNKNLNSVMETGDHSKNGASPKSLMSRENFKKRTDMKKFFVIMMVGVAMIGCNKQEGEDSLNKLDKDGLTQDIRNIIPDDILKAFKDLGIEINGGNNPPNVEGTYLASPYILVRSNFRDSFTPGAKFADFRLTFSRQNNSNLTIVTDYVQRSQSGEIIEEGNGLGSFITGNGNKFTVFVEISGTHNGLPFKSVQLFTGEITSSGIKNFHTAVLCTMENRYTIKRGEGRMFTDSDGLAERIR